MYIPRARLHARNNRALERVLEEFAYLVSRILQAISGDESSEDAYLYGTELPNSEEHIAKILRRGVTGEECLLSK